MKKTRWIALALALGLLMCLFTGCSGSRDPRQGVVRVLSQYEVKDGLYLEINGEPLYLFEGYTSSATGSAFGVGKAWEETDTFVTNRHVVENETQRLDMQDILDALGIDATWQELGLSPYWDMELVLTDVYILLDDYACKVDSNGDVTVDTSRAVPCQVLYQSPATGPDVAILKAANDVPGRVALPVTRAEDGVKVGDNVTAIGFPADSDITAATEYADVRIYGSMESSTLTRGVVSRFTTMASEGNTRVIQHGAQINSGNSGGPLVNEKNQVVGINTWGWGDNSQGAIYVDYALDALDTLHFDIPSPGPDSRTILLIAVAVVAIAAAAAALYLVLRKKGGKKAAGMTLVCTAGLKTGERIPLGSGQVTIGRDSSSTLVYPQDYPGISNRHCCLWTEGKTTYIRDLGSSFGTFVDGVQLTVGENRPLKEGAMIQLGAPKDSFTVTRKGGV